MKPIKLKTILNESLLGIMPSSKLMKMKWNPVTEADVFDTGATDGEDQSKVMDKLQKKFEGPLKSIIDLIKTKEDLNAAVSMLITKSEETTTGLGKRSKPVLLATNKALQSKLMSNKYIDNDGKFNHGKWQRDQIDPMHLNEAKPDGTISDDEEEREDDLMEAVETAIDDLIDKIEREAYKIGGYFRSPSITARAAKLIKAKLQKARL